MAKTNKLVLSLIIIYLSLMAHPSIVFSASTPRSLTFSLSEAVKTAVDNNVGIQVERENVRLRESTLSREKAQFDPTLSLDFRADRTIRSSSSLIETGPSGTNRIIQENQRLSTGINQRFRWGGDADLTLRQTRAEASFQNINPTYNGDLVFSFTQPLLKGFGRVVSEGPIRIANTDIAISQADFESQVSSLILDVSTSYWDLVFQLKNLSIQQQTLQSAKQLLESTQAKVDLGLLAPIEILVSESGVASREEAVFIAEKGVLDIEDQLRIFLNLPWQSILHPPPIVPTDQPTEKERSIDARAQLQLAISNRPEVSENQLLLQNQSLTTKIAINNLSPSLDLIGSLGLNGLGKDFSGETDQIGTGSFNQWELGLVLSFPIGNKAARADLLKERIRLKQVSLDQRKLTQQILLETKEGLRRVQTDFQRIKVTQHARHLSAEKLSAGNERFHLGLISNQDLLEFQDDLADAKGNELKAIIDYNKSLVNLEHVSGTLLQRYQIETLSSREETR